jgi:2-polyprenyl-3-methyl-5-hydroxy-6-metoxy-1,4-benzoquinol methylase
MNKFSENDFRKYGFGKEQSKSFYDERFSVSSHWSENYKKSRYFEMWKGVANILLTEKPLKILELGCGPGQLANLLHDLGIANYTGVDFSFKAIQSARLLCQDYVFIESDIIDCNLLFELDYDCVITTEFLEHVEKDLEVIEKVKSNTIIIASVPNFTSVAHVRFFTSKDLVLERYSVFFKDITIQEYELNDSKTIFLFYGVRK